MRTPFSVARACLVAGLCLFSFSVFAQPDYHITVEDGQLKNGKTNFHALTINYMVNLTKDFTNNTWHVEPHWNYSSDWVQNQYTGPTGRFWMGIPSVANAKVQADLDDMSDKKFNTIRAVGITPEYDYGTNDLLIPSGNMTTYLAMLDDLVQKAENSDIRIIMLLKAPETDVMDDQYAKFLTDVATHYSANKTVMAIDFWNEPGNYGGYKNYKIFNASRVTRWVDAVKNAAPNLLTTIGFAYWESTVGWDQAVLPIDFASPHAYGWSEDVQLGNNVIGSMSHWYRATCAKPWIVGETGYSGTDDNPLNNPDVDNRVGSEQEQRDFAEFTLDRTRDCECSGYSWWTYQELFWSVPVSPFEDYLGLKTRYSALGGESWKDAVNAFDQFDATNVQTINCKKPTNYYNVFGGTGIQLSGIVRDAATKLPIENAEVYAKTTTWSNSFTYTKSNGAFNLHAKSGPAFHAARVSAPGYDEKYFSTPAAGSNLGTIYLNKYDYINNWMKEYDNGSSNQMDSWTMGSSDDYYPGDFDGDGRDELLCVAGNVISMLDYVNGEWNQVWTTGGSTSHGMYPYRHTLHIGDFNGDGRDEVLGNNTANNGWITMFRYESGNFVWKWTDNGSHAMQPYGDDLIVGDFNGDGRDEILGNDEDNNGWITLFRFEGFTQPWSLSMGDFVWKWTDNGSHAMQPYRDDLIVGDFDGDGKDEILGRQTWNTLFELEGFSNPWSLSNADFEWKWTSGTNRIIGDMVVDGSYTLVPFADKQPFTSLLVLSQNSGGNNLSKLFRRSLFPVQKAVQHNRVFVAGSAESDWSDDVVSEDAWNGPVAYPNPTRNEISVDLGPDFATSQLVVYNVQGQVIADIQQPVQQVVSTELPGPQGLYFVEVRPAAGDPVRIKVAKVR